VLGADGAIYGAMTTENVNPLSPGFVFRLDTTGIMSSIHTLTFDEGYTTQFALGSDGLIYGASTFINSGNGAVFRFDNAGTFTMLHLFTYTDGQYPLAPLTVGSDGATYGVTQKGGPAFLGTAFRIDVAGTFTSLASFGSSSAGWPNQPLSKARDGSLYATVGDAELIQITSPGTVNTHQFAPALQPRGYLMNVPLDALVQGNDCALYGAYQ
jgi:uncharacterized repeat protein (TIGR03803 family)